MLTPDHLRRRAAALERQAAKLRAEADAIEAAIRRTLERSDSERGIVKVIMNGIVTTDETSRNHNSTDHDTEAKRRLGIAKARAGVHPFPQAVIASGQTVADWAKARGLKPYTVRMWYGQGRTGRPIPRQWAEAIERDMGIPVSAWPRGITGS